MTGVGTEAGASQFRGAKGSLINGSHTPRATMCGRLAGGAAGNDLDANGRGATDIDSGGGATGNNMAPMVNASADRITVQRMRAALSTLATLEKGGKREVACQCSTLNVFAGTVNGVERHMRDAPFQLFDQAPDQWVCAIEGHCDPVAQVWLIDTVFQRVAYVVQR